MRRSTLTLAPPPREPLRAAAEDVATVKGAF